MMAHIFRLDISFLKPGEACHYYIPIVLEDTDF